MSDRGYTTDRGLQRSVDGYVGSDLYGSEMHKGVLTLTCRVDKRAMEARKTGDITRKYPLGDRYGLDVQEDDLCFGAKSSRGKGTSESIPFFGPLNGLNWGGAATWEELEDMFFFLGLSRSDFVMTDDPINNVPVDETGCTVQMFGTSNIRSAWQEHVFPGDRIVWRFPRTEDVKAMTSGRGSTRDPATRITACLGVLDWTGVKYMWNNVAQIVLRSANDIGISHHLLKSHQYDPRRADDGTTSYVRCARALKAHQLITVAKGVEVLHQRGIIAIVDPWTEKRRTAERDLLRALLIERGGNLAGTKKPLVGASAETGRLYDRYVEVMAEQRTDVTRGTNAGSFSSDHRMSHPYTYYTTGTHFAKSGSISDYTDEVNPDAVVGSLQADQLFKLNQELWLGKVLGVIDAPYGGDGANSEGAGKVINDVLNATMMGHAEPENKRMYAMGTGMQRTALARVMDENKVLKRTLDQYLAASLQHMERLAQFMCVLQDRETSDHVIGTAYSYASPNKLHTKIDILVGKK